LAVVLGAAGTASCMRTRAILIREFDAELRAEAIVLTANTEYDQDGKIQLDTAGFVMPEFDRDEYYQIWLPDGQIVGRSPSLGFDDLPQREGDVKLPNGHAGRAVV